MLQDEEDYKRENFLFILLMSVNVAITLVVMLAGCLCCKKKIPKNDLMGLEGMVKLKNPDEVVVVTTLNTSESHADLNNSTISQGDSEKRASTAAHRSLPDIPVAEVNGDTGSELYETVADKMLSESQNQNKSPTPSLKKQISVSQHSSISQADDVSSPYSRVKNSPHDYAKVRPTEHPYAQLNAPSTSQSANNSQVSTSHVDISAQTTGSQASANNEQQHQQRSSHHSDNSQNHNETPAPQIEIPAASAIAGMISASQDLPYMTPPIANQHFSGDSQDSSKGYTSISVREPLANILAQQPVPQTQIRSTTHSRDVNDSHYATVSDDSDETYAAIEDPNTRLQHANTTTDIYTSGSETYAQIQPMQSPNSILVSVEINNASTSTLASSNSTLTGVGGSHHNSSFLSSDHANTSLSSQHSTSTIIGPIRTSLEHTANNTPIPPPVDSLRAQMHSRQASASSNNSSSLCNLGSPKPEKRQANSPLPPTPKSNLSSTTQLQAMSSTSNLTSGRNSVISVIECAGELSEMGYGEIAQQDGSPKRRNKSLSPSKDIEGMYAKVMKKNKFSRNSPSSQNNSPVLPRKNEEHASTNMGISPLDSKAADLLENSVSVLSTNDGSRLRSNSYGATKDHGYETIPADAMRSNSSHGVIENRKSDCYAHILQKERQREGVHTSSKPPITVYSVQLNNSDKHYETIANPDLTNSSNDPGYETLLKPKINSSLIDDSEKKSSDYDPNYEVLKGPNVKNVNSAGASDDGYAKVMEKKRINIDEDSIDGYSKVKGEECDDVKDAITGGYSTIKEPDANHNYASILEAKGVGCADSGSHETDSDHYARIAEKNEPNTPNLSLSNSNKSMAVKPIPTTNPSVI
ncbi:uncharacterized protein ACRADG_000504 isoform 2-T2 [Cochliomyia hominivorax]